jgi:hypothetical protein
LDTRSLGETMVGSSEQERPSGEYGGTEAENRAPELEGPFALGANTETAGEILGEILAPELSVPSETLSTSPSAEVSESHEHPTEEAPGGTSLAGSYEFDPYGGIRQALLPDAAHLTADEISLKFGRRPAILALHQMLISPELQQAMTGRLLGGSGRRWIRVNGADISVSSYLRLLSRLCREVAEQSEKEVSEASETPVEHEFPATSNTGAAMSPPQQEKRPVRR